MFDGWDLVADPPPLERDFQTIVVAGRPFAVPADAVRGHLGATTATPVPGALGFVRGVLMWEGQVIPVVSTSAQLALPVLRDAPNKPLLQLEVGGEAFFLEVDAIDDVIAGGRLEPSDGEIPMVAGFIETSSDRVPVLDLDAVTSFGASREPVR